MREVLCGVFVSFRFSDFTITRSVNHAALPAVVFKEVQPLRRFSLTSTKAFVYKGACGHPSTQETSDAQTNAAATDGRGTGYLASPLATWSQYRPPGSGNTESGTRNRLHDGAQTDANHDRKRPGEAG